MNALVDTGFVDAAAARSMVAKIRLRLQLQLVQASIARQLNVLNHGLEPDRETGAPLFESTVALVEGDLQGTTGCEVIDLVEGKHMREQELLKGVDLVLQLIEALGKGIDQGLFSVRIGNGLERKRAADSTHRLCGGGK